MSAITMSVSEFATKVEEVIANLKRNEEVIITGDHNQVIAKLVPANEPAVTVAEEAKPKRRRAGTAEGTFWMSPDFNAPLDEFKEYME
jgi:antitoxin (DNA-binding transcriptional repressor) of toxin-antitoxin stability system